MSVSRDEECRLFFHECSLWIHGDHGVHKSKRLQFSRTGLSLSRRRWHLQRQRAQGNLSGVPGKKKAHVRLLSFIAALSRYVINTSVLRVGHTKAIQLFRFNFNSEFSYLPVYPVSICKSFGIDFQFLAGHLHLDVPGKRKTSWLTIYLYHLFESLFSAYRKWG